LKHRKNRRKQNNRAVKEIKERRVAYMRDYCDSVSIENKIKQIPVLLLGIIIYTAITLLAYKKSADSFDKLDL